VPSSTSPRRGQVVRMRLDPVEGSEQAGERPVLVISPTFLNERAPVILVAAITSQKTERIYPTEVLIDPPEGGLPRRSKVLLLHLRSVSKTRIIGHYGAVSEATMQRVAQAIQIVTGLVEI